VASPLLAVDHRVVDQTFIGMFGCTTGLPARMRTLDYDNVWGSVTCDPALSAWQAIGALDYKGPK